MITDLWRKKILIQSKNNQQTVAVRGHEGYEQYNTEVDGRMNSERGQNCWSDRNTPTNKSKLNQNGRRRVWTESRKGKGKGENEGAYLLPPLIFKF
jgi:hypothetical protein